VASLKQLQRLNRAGTEVTDAGLKDREWNNFIRLIDRAHPKKNQLVQMDIFDVGVPIDPED
jgi:hypothetical protein